MFFFSKFHHTFKRIFTLDFVVLLLIFNYLTIGFAKPLGTEEDPVYTDNVPISAGTAVVIGTAGTAIVISNACLRSWRTISLSKFHSLRLANIPLLVLTLAATAAISCFGAIKLFTDDTRALGGLMPILGVLSPFIYFAGAPEFIRSSPPTTTRLLAWLFASPLNVIILIPGILFQAACVWIMVKFKSWDVLAITFSLAVAVLTRTDPLIYYSWDGRGSRWQWGRLLPSPVRMSAFRLVIGRAETGTGEVEILSDAMEVPLEDSTAFDGRLHGETRANSDQSLAASMRDRGVLASIPLFYDYMDTVWTHIIHDVRRGSLDERRKLDQCAASCVLLILTMLRDALSSKHIGADVWLLLAIFRCRMNQIGDTYETLSANRSASITTRLREYLSDGLSLCFGRRVEAATIIDSSLLARLEEANTDNKEDDTDVNEEVKASVQESKSNKEDDIENQTSVNTKLSDEENSRTSLRMHQSLKVSENPPPPEGQSTETWTTWIMDTLNEMYIGAIYVSKQPENEIGSLQVSSMSETLYEWFGDDLVTLLRNEITEVLEFPVENGEASRMVENISLMEGSTSTVPYRTVVEEVQDKVETTEMFTYIMLSMSSREIISNMGNSNSGFGFESAHIDVANGELDGRLKAQNMSRKVLLAQIGLWTYVALGQTATALLSRN